jgi:hypothetical protein
MPTIEPKESRKELPQSPPLKAERKVDRDDDRETSEAREARERARVDPCADEIPSICRGMD